MVARFCPPTAAQIVRGRRRLELCASAGLATEFVTPRVDHGYIGAKLWPPFLALRASIAVLPLCSRDQKPRVCGRCCETPRATSPCTHRLGDRACEAPADSQRLG